MKSTRLTRTPVLLAAFAVIFMLSPINGAGAATGVSASGSLLVFHDGASQELAPGWLPLHGLANGMIGLVASASLLPSDPSWHLLESYRGPDLYLLVTPSTASALERGDLPPDWQTILDESGVSAPSSGVLRSIPLLVRDNAKVLIRLPESLRCVAERAPSRTGTIPGVEEARRMQQAEMDRSGPAEDAAARQDQGMRLPPSPLPFWQGLTRAVNSDHLFSDLDYLSTTLQTRYYSTAELNLACQYVYDQFASLGLTTSFDNYTYNGHALKNVLGVKLGTVDPSRIYVIVGHLDSTSPDPLHHAPGADDNGSGAVAVIEAARLLANLPSDYTIYFLCVTAEEQGLRGSEHFAAQADAQNLDIRGVLCMDMVSWYNSAGADLWIEGFHQGVSSVWLMSLVQGNALTYTGMSVYLYPGEGWGSDHEPFHDHGYSAILSIENEWESYPCYHQTCDTVDRCVGWFWAKIAAANAVTLGQLAQTQGDLGEIDGTVTVNGGGDASGVTLRLTGTTYGDLISDALGHFDWSEVFPGTYTLSATKTGFLPTTVNVSVESGATTDIQVEMAPLQPSVVQGTVRTVTGEPVPGARIDVEGEGIFAQSGPDGSYTLSPLSAGTFNLSAMATGMVPRGSSVTLTQGQVVNGIDFTLSPIWSFESSSEGLVTSAGWQWGSDAMIGAHSGSRIWGTRLNSSYDDCADYRLNFPPISLIPYDTAVLHFWTWYRSQGGKDGGNLEVSTDSGNTWIVIHPAGGYTGSVTGACNPLDGEPAYTGVQNVWTERVFSLTPYTGGWVRLRLCFGSDGSIEDRGWFIDDLALNETLTTVGTPVRSGPETTGVSLRATPNPAPGGTWLELRLPSAQEGRLEIFAADGRMVADLTPPDPMGTGAHRFLWSARDESGGPVASGVYWARWSSGGSETKRAIIVLR